MFPRASFLIFANNMPFYKFPTLSWMLIVCKNQERSSRKHWKIALHCKIPLLMKESTIIYISDISKLSEQKWLRWHSVLPLVHLRRLQLGGSRPKIEQRFAFHLACTLQLHICNGSNKHFRVSLHHFLPIHADLLVLTAERNALLSNLFTIVTVVPNHKVAKLVSKLAILEYAAS